MLDSPALSWTPYEAFGTDEVDVPADAEQHPDVVALKEACAHAPRGYAPMHHYLADADSPIVRWAIEHGGALNGDAVDVEVLGVDVHVAIRGTR